MTSGKEGEWSADLLNFTLVFKWPELQLTSCHASCSHSQVLFSEVKVLENESSVGQLDYQQEAIPPAG